MSRNQALTSFSQDLYVSHSQIFTYQSCSLKYRFHKLKTPKLEIVQTVRTAQDRKRFAKIANAVLEGIDAGIYMPQPSWMCLDCAYSKACKSW